MKQGKFFNLDKLKNFILKYNSHSEISIIGDKDQTCSASIANLCLRWSEFNSIKHKIDDKDDNEYSFVRIKHVIPLPPLFIPDPYFLERLNKENLLWGIASTSIYYKYGEEGSWLLDIRGRDREFGELLRGERVIVLWSD